MQDRQLYDPLRGKYVAFTPEEGVRQWFIGVLHEQFKVPMGVMMSEVTIKFGRTVSIVGGQKRKQFRADIVVYDRKAEPLMIVECKRPEVVLDDIVLAQALNYASILAVRHVAVTNGEKTFFASRKDGKLQFADSIPEYEEMLR